MKKHTINATDWEGTEVEKIIASSTKNGGKSLVLAVDVCEGDIAFMVEAGGAVQDYHKSVGK